MQLNKPNISIIIPVYNAESSILRTLDSILSQTLDFRCLEILLVDDCSTDNSFSLISKFAAQYDNVRVFQTKSPSGSAGAPRNVGLDNASAPYIMFLDNDDVLLPDACNKMLSEISSRELDFLQGTHYTLDSSGKTTFINKSSQLTGFKVFLPLVWDKIYNRSFIETHSIRFPEGFLAEDDAFTALCLCFSDNYDTTDTPVIKYSIGSSSISSSTANEFWRHNIYGSYDYALTCAINANVERRFDSIYKSNGQFALFASYILDIDDFSTAEALLLGWKRFFSHAYSSHFISDTYEATILFSSAYYCSEEEYKSIITSMWCAKHCPHFTHSITPNGNVILSCQQDSTYLFNSVDQYFNEHNIDSIQMGQFPFLTKGFLNIDNILCVAPPNGILAVSKHCYEVVGAYDECLGWASTTDYYYRLLDHGMTCKAVPSILAPSYVTTPSDITDLWLDGLLLDYKHGNIKLRSSVIKTIFFKLAKYDSSIGNYSRNIVLKRLPAFIKTLKQYSSHLGHETKSFNFLSHFTKRGVDVLPYYPNNNFPKVSIVVRTHDRVPLLRKTLNILRSLTYSNYEVIVVEDGPDTCGDMIHNDFSDLPIIYHPTIEHVGRSAAANIGCHLASGKYINFLDDDDFFYPEHITAGVLKAEAADLDMVFLQGLSMSVVKTGLDPYDYVAKDFNFMNFPRLDPFTMSSYCKTPNNGVLFKKELLNFAVGMREDLDANEDWSLWLRMLTRAKYDIFRYATCCFCVPYYDIDRDERMKSYAKYTGLQLVDDSLWFTTSYEQLKKYYIGLFNDFEALKVSHQIKSSIEYDYSYWHIEDENPLLQAFNEWIQYLKTHSGGSFSALQFNHYYLGAVVYLKNHGSIPNITEIV